MTAKTLSDLTHECCMLSCIAGGLELLIVNAGDGDNATMRAARDAIGPISSILAARLDALHNDLDGIEAHYEAAAKGA